jgi:hypothetical protein
MAGQIENLVCQLEEFGDARVAKRQPRTLETSLHRILWVSPFKMPDNA